MTETVRPKLITTTDLERSLAGKLAVANRYGADRDREIEQLEARLVKLTTTAQVQRATTSLSPSCRGLAVISAASLAPLKSLFR